MTKENPDIRWKQRFQNYQKALSELRESVELSKCRPLSKLERQGIIQAFEFTHELAWNVMRDFILYQGDSTITGSRDATRISFKMGLIEDGEIWMDMIQSRNLTSHTYNQDISTKIYNKITGEYYGLFELFETSMKKRMEP